jgi:soluble lytic murein transglycosylase
VLLVIVAILLALPFALRVPAALSDALWRAVYPLRYEATIRQASEENGLDPAFVAGVIYTESRFRPNVESHKEAYGLMQLLPQSAHFIQRKSGIKGDYRDPKVNIMLGTWFLGYLNDRYEGDERFMLAAYNSGEGSVDTWTSEDGFDIEKDIPYKETREYVDRALEAQKTYRELYGSDLRESGH